MIKFVSIDATKVTIEKEGLFEASALGALAIFKSVENQVSEIRQNLSQLHHSDARHHEVMMARLTAERLHSNVNSLYKALQLLEASAYLLVDDRVLVDETGSWNHVEFIDTAGLRGKLRFLKIADQEFLVCLTGLVKTFKYRHSPEFQCVQTDGTIIFVPETFISAKADQYHLPTFGEIDLSRKHTITTPKFWDCDCKETDDDPYNYIRPHTSDFCPRCKVSKHDGPDSRVSEVLAKLNLVFQLGKL